MKLWFVLASALAASNAAAAPAAERFDLLCDGTYTDMGSAPKAFSSRFHIDLASMRFCTDECSTVLHLTGVSSETIEYHYDVSIADKDHRANRFRGGMTSTAGPFPFKEDFAINLTSGQFQRFYRYDYGDHGVVPHAERYAGHCRRAEFTPFPTQPR